MFCTVCKQFCLRNGWHYESFVLSLANNLALFEHHSTRLASGPAPGAAPPSTRKVATQSLSLVPVALVAGAALQSQVMSQPLERELPLPVRSRTAGNLASVEHVQKLVKVFIVVVQHAVEKLVLSLLASHTLRATVSEVDKELALKPRALTAHTRAESLGARGACDSRCRRCYSTTVPQLWCRQPPVRQQRLRWLGRPAICQLFWGGSPSSRKSSQCKAYQ